MALLGVDAGSSGCKAVVFSEEGRQLSVGRSSYSPVSARVGEAELDPDVFFACFAKAVRLAVGKCSHKVEAMAISSHGESIVPIAPNGNIAGNMIMNSDNRAVAEAKQLENMLGCERLYSITGSVPHAMFALPKIVWHKQNGSHKARRYLSPSDYLLFSLGFPPLTDFSLASRVLAFDIHSKKWSKEILDTAGVLEEELPVPVQAGEIAGKLTKQTAEPLGLPEGVTVVVGGHDQPCGALGMGVIAEGDISVSAGTYECITTASNQPQNSIEALKFSLNSYCHVVRDSYVTLAFFPAAIGVSWFVEQLCVQEALLAKELDISVYEVLEKEQAKFPGPTGVCIVPHWVGACNPRWDVSATGKISGLTPACSRAELYKAFYEGIACELDLNIKALETIIGNIPSLKISGGGARSEFTVRLRANIAEKPFVLIDSSEVVCQGAAMLAGVGVGTYSSVANAVDQMVRTAKVIAPDVILAQQYRKQRDQYARLAEF